MDASHLIGTVVQSLKPDFTEVAADETREFVSSLADRFFDGFLGVFKKQEVDILFRFVPLPHADHLSVSNNGREGIVDQLSLPARKRLVCMFGPQETIHDFTLTLQKGVSVRNQADGRLHALRGVEIVE